MMRRLSLLTMLAALSLMMALPASATSKREFRGAWIQTIFQSYEKRSTAENQAYLRSMLDSLQATGINAVIFQVRPRADAFYSSSLEPWSSFLTGQIGRAPQPAWDPLEFMTSECHARGMELHAWLNPYRAPTVAERPKLPASHLLVSHPERFIRYGKGYYFDPALSENRELICSVVRDIITRYDVDGIHFDDYFYPYPIPGQKFDDDKSYAATGAGMSRGDWRRHNVDLLIEAVHRVIADTRPWVRFGISPFGIWRNSTSDPSGSATAGLQNYDDLYADVPRWAANGWIDYQIPQLYWEINHPKASYSVLCDWWAQHGHGRHVYIGQDVKRTAQASELTDKLARIHAHGPERLQGCCWWYAANLIDGVAPRLRAEAYTTPALVPEYLWLNVEPAPKPEGVAYSDGTLSWHPSDSVGKWVVYRFDSPEDEDIDDPAAILAVTYTPKLAITRPGFYVVTALDRANGESAPSLPLYIPSL